MDLNHRQFERIAEQLNYHGGVTATTSGKTAGEPPPHKFVVGTEAEGGFAPDPVSGEHLMRYAEDRRDVLQRSNRYLGGWQDGGRTHLDTPRGYPATPAGEAKARKATIAENQMAYGHLGAKGKYQGDIHNPYHPANRSGDIVADDAPGQRKVWSEMKLHAPPPNPPATKTDLRPGSYR